MGRKTQMSITEEETLAECVRKYPCLYDKSDQFYKDKYCVTNAWKEIDKELGYEEGEAEAAFTNLKKRYSRKRNDLKNAKRSGAGLQDIQKFEKLLEPYQFFKWIDNYIKLRSDTRSNLPSQEPEETDEGNENESYGCDDEDEDASNQDDLQSASNQHEESQYADESVILRQKATGKNAKRSAQKYFYGEGDKTAASSKDYKKLKKNSTGADDGTTEVLKAISKRISEKTAASNVQKDEDDVFGAMLTTELKSLPKTLKIRLKHEINNLIFKYQMASVQQEQLVNETYHSTSSPSTSFSNPKSPSIELPYNSSNFQPVTTPKQGVFYQNFGGKLSIYPPIKQLPQLPPMSYPQGIGVNKQ